jgi:hypothetical protein
MRHGSLLVPILITYAAIEAIEPPTLGVGGHLACFNKHRNTFEEAAHAKHHRQPFTEDGMVTVDAGDLKIALGVTRRSISVDSPRAEGDGRNSTGWPLSLRERTAPRRCC